VKFILATTDPQRLPVTVLSRCLQFNLKPLPPPAIAGHLKRVLEVEGVAFDEAALALIAKAAAGSVRDSLSLLDQAIAHGGGKVERAQVAEMLGTLGGDLVWPILERLAEGDGAGAIAEADRLAARSVSFDTALEDIAAILHRIALAQAGAGVGDDSDRDRLQAMAQRIEAPRVQVMYQIALLARRDLALAPDEYAGFTMALLRMLTFAGTPDSQPRATPREAPRESRPVTPPARAAAPPPATVAFGGDWAGYVAKLNLTGMAGMVARHGELASFENNKLELVVPEAQRMYAERPYQEKLQAELAPHFGPGFRLVVRVGPTAGASLAAVRSREDEERRESAAEAIEGDPFVRELVRDLGAEVVSSSIKPADEPRKGPSGQKG
jgi:DNA polymerase-3 subunit gamma/tau